MRQPITLFRETDAAKYLGISVHTLRKDRQQDNPSIPFTTIKGSIRYIQSDLDKMIESNRRG